MHFVKVYYVCVCVSKVHVRNISTVYLSSRKKNYPFALTDFSSKSADLLKGVFKFDIWTDMICILKIHLNLEFISLEDTELIKVQGREFKHLLRCISS